MSTRTARKLMLLLICVVGPLRAGRGQSVVWSIEYTTYKFRSSFCGPCADLCLQAKLGNSEKVSWYLVHGADPDTYDYGPDLGSNLPETVLTTAVQARRANIVQILLMHGANVGQPGGMRCPLQAAAETGDVQIGRILLDHGADVDGGNVLYTPLMLAACDNKYAFAKLLLSRGADTTLKNNLDQTAEQLARQEGHALIATLIRQYSRVKAASK